MGQRPGGLRGFPLCSPQSRPHLPEKSWKPDTQIEEEGRKKRTPHGCVRGGHGGFEGNHMQGRAAAEGGGAAGEMEKEVDGDAGHRVW